MNKKELIVITGAGQGIGAYLAEKFSYKYDILLISKSRNCKKNSDKINKINKNSADYLMLDFEKDIDFRILDEKVNIDNFANIHLIFCAGYVEDFSEDININEWRKVFNINVFAHLELLDYFTKLLEKTGENKNIIFLSGGGAANSFPTFPAYSASKTALVRIVENLSIRYQDKGFNIFAIAPGAIKTKMLEKVLKSADVGTRTTKEELYEFINYYLEKKTKALNGKLVHIRDEKIKLEENHSDNFLKLRRVE